MISWGTVPLGAVLPFPFATYAGATGASITLTGLAVTDIEVYKGTSVVQRASDVGYTLIDTDGIDIDLITGIHGFAIDTGDNTDAGFFVAGSYYYVIVSAVTVDAQTVNFVAGTFTLRATESVAGVIEVDLTHVAGATTNVAALATNVDAILTDTGTTLDGRIPAALVAGRMDASVGAVAANTLTAAALATDAVDEIVDQVWNEAKSGHLTAGTYGEHYGAATESATVNDAAASTTVFVTTLVSGVNSHYIGRIIIFTSGVLLNQATEITAYVGATKQITCIALTSAPANGVTFIVV